MQIEQGTGRQQSGRTRYVFAGTEDGEERRGTKICPRCGQMLFDDMTVCYGCLYDFTRDRHGARQSDEALRAQARSLARVPLVDDSLERIALDEIDDEDHQRVPRHRKETGVSADDTLDLAPAARKLQAVSDVPTERPYQVVIDAPGMQVKVPLGKHGLTVGRDEGNDVVLRSRSVSRRHLRLTLRANAVFAEDQGATNPALLHGEPLGESVPLAEGDELVVCGTSLTLTRP